MDIVNNQLNCDSKHYDRCKFASKLIPLLTTSNLFPLEVVQNANIANLYYGKTRYIFMEMGITHRFRQPSASSTNPD